MPFDEIIKAIRKELNMTQEQLAHELNISFSTINRWENSHTSPSKLAKMRLLEFCGRKSVNTFITSEIDKL
ncbi:MAG: helix-turn-helix transcriptional regulator [Bacteroidaceae bacterium]|jgi:transcriptional regulator with XRE-family HTH domain|nr:helix-turn-helix transcriptional regulator [Bacteroidaceae bacterium]